MERLIDGVWYDESELDLSLDENNEIIYTIRGEDFGGHDMTEDS